MAFQKALIALNSSDSALVQNPTLQAQAVRLRRTWGRKWKGEWQGWGYFLRNQRTHLKEGDFAFLVWGVAFFLHFPKKPVQSTATERCQTPSFTGSLRVHEKSPVQCQERTPECPTHRARCPSLSLSQRESGLLRPLCPREWIFPP